MSRGPGRVELAINAAFTQHPERTFSIEELAPIAYPGVNRVEKKHRVAILRAADKVARRAGWRGRRAERRGGEVIYYSLVNVRSYALGRLRASWVGRRLNECEDRVDNPGASNSEWADMQPGGVLAIHVEINKADLRGDAEEGERLRGDLEAISALSRERFAAKWGGAA